MITKLSIFDQTVISDTFLQFFFNNVKPGRRGGGWLVFITLSMPLFNLTFLHFIVIFVRIRILDSYLTKQNYNNNKKLNKNLVNFNYELHFVLIE